MADFSIKYQNKISYALVGLHGYIGACKGLYGDDECCCSYVCTVLVLLVFVIDVKATILQEVSK